MFVADRQEIEQRLGGVFVPAVARVDHVRRDAVAKEIQPRRTTDGE